VEVQKQPRPCGTICPRRVLNEYQGTEIKSKNGKWKDIRRDDIKESAEQYAHAVSLIDCKR